MKIIAFDQSTVKTGYAVMKNGDLLDHGVIDLHFEENIEARSRIMFEEISRLIKENKPNAIVIEGVAMQTNAQVLIKLGQLQGQIMALAWQKNLPLRVYLPTQWRKLHGFKQGRDVKRAQLKIQTIEMIKLEYGIDAPEDEAEAIAIALAFFKDAGENPEEQKEIKGNGKKNKKSKTK